jgi:hypothetical protein
MKIFFKCLTVLLTVALFSFSVQAKNELGKPVEKKTIKNSRSSFNFILLRNECASTVAYINAPCPVIPGVPYSGGVWAVASVTTVTCSNSSGQVISQTTTTRYVPYDSNPCGV